MLRDHGYGASTSPGMPDYALAFPGRPTKCLSVNNLSTVATRQRGGRGSNSRPPSQ